MVSGRHIQRIVAGRQATTLQKIIRLVKRQKPAIQTKISSAQANLDETSARAQRTATRMRTAHPRTKQYREAATRLHEIAREWAKQTGKMPTATDLIAIEALSKDLDSTDIVHLVSVMKSIHQRNKDELTWMGNPSHAKRAVLNRVNHTNKNILASVEEQLFLAQVPLTSRQIADNLKLDYSKTKTAIEASLQILERARFIERGERGHQGKSNAFFWTHRAQPRERNVVDNPRHQILERIAAGRIQISALFQKRAGMATPSEGTVYAVVRALIQNGLGERINIPPEHGRSRPLTYIQLTPAGKEQWESQTHGRLQGAFKKIVMEKAPSVRKRKS